MKKIYLVTVTVTAAAIVSSAGSAFAVFPHPAKAGSFKGTLVQAFADCAAPNDSTDGSLALPACHPAVPRDAGCTFGPKGQGLVQASVSGTGKPSTCSQDKTIVCTVDADCGPGNTCVVNNKQDIKFQAQLKGMDAGCIGETICVFGAVNVSTTACASNDPDGCTVLAALTNPFPLGGPACCVVDVKGNCKIKTTAETVIGSDTFNGKNITVEFRTLGVRRTSAVNSPSPASGQPSFVAGLFGPGNP